MDELSKTDTSRGSGSLPSCGVLTVISRHDIRHLVEYYGRVPLGVHKESTCDAC